MSSIPGSGRFPQGENGNPLPYSCLKKSHAQRNLEGYNPKGGKELATAEHKHTEENSRCLWETVIGLLLGFDWYETIDYRSHCNTETGDNREMRTKFPLKPQDWTSPGVQHNKMEIIWYIQDLAKPGTHGFAALHEENLKFLLKALRKRIIALR